MPHMYRNALSDPQIPPNAETQVRRNVHDTLFVESVLVLPKYKK
jgi:hypothetical protein